MQELIKELQTVANRCDLDDNYDINDAAEDIREIANNLEKVVTPCNQLVTRKAMEEIKAIIKVWNRALVSTKKTIETIEEIATQVLDTPPRNCDIGSAAEQYKRWEQFCLKIKWCVDCKLNGDGGYGKCFLKFLRMPYNKDEAKGEAK